MITLQPQNKFMTPKMTQRNTFGNGGHHHNDEERKPRPVDASKKESHPPLGNYAKKAFYAGMAGIAIFAGTTIIKGPKPHRVAEQQVKAIVSKNTPDSTLKRLVKEQEEKNRKAAEKAKRLIDSLGFEF